MKSAHRPSIQQKDDIIESINEDDLYNKKPKFDPSQQAADVENKI